MTTSERSPLPGLTLGRRSLLLFGGLGVASTAALGLGQTSAAAADAAPQVDFNLDTDNYLKALGATDEHPDASPTSDIFGSMDVTTFLWVNRITSIAAFDAVAPYHETAVGIYTRIKRRPSSEFTNRNKNIAGLYAGWRVWQGVFGEKPGVREFLVAIGLDPDDESEDPTSPIGIGNIVGKAAFAAHQRDGMNFVGDEGGRRYNPLPWADYTGYQPVNTAFDLVNPSRWQPRLGPHNGRRLGGGPGDVGIYVVQHMVTPQARKVRSLIFSDPSQFKIAPPDFSDHTNSRLYKRSVDEILEASAALTDEQKAIAEVVDNKRWGIGFSAVHILETHDRNGEQGIAGWAFFFLSHVLATFDTMIAVWYQKVKFDAVRPTSAVRHVYGRRPLTAWGGPGKGRVHDIPADQWASYLPTGDHPEYPSGSANLCAAASQAARRYFGDDILDWNFTFPARSSKREPGFAPANDVELHFPTWTDFTTKCAQSRFWGGVHFLKTVQRSIPFGEPFGDMAHDFVHRHIIGDVKD